MRKVENLGEKDYLRRLQESGILYDGEEARQIDIYNGAYFITDKARVISCFDKMPRVLRAQQRGGKRKAAEYDTMNNNVKHFVKLSLGNGESRDYYIHSLVAEYFPEKLGLVYLTGKGDDMVHHIDGYDIEHPEESNDPRCLEKMDDRYLHLLMHKTKLSPQTVSKSLNDMKNFANHTKQDGIGTVMECPDENGKGGKIYELAEPIEIDEDKVLSQEMADKFSKIFLKQGQTLVQLVWYKGDAKDLDAIVEDYKVIEREELKATAPKKKISRPKKAKDGGAVETA